LTKRPRVLEAGAAEAASGGEQEQADWIGQLALVEALRGRLARAAELVGRAILAAGEHRSPGWNPNPAPLVALAWAHLDAMSCARRGWIKQADAALGARPDKLTGAVAYLVAAGGALTEGRAAVAAQIITRARSGWAVPAWLDQQLQGRLPPAPVTAVGADELGVGAALADPPLPQHDYLVDLVESLELVRDEQGRASGCRSGYE
jgi:hypothetical protein